MDEKDFFAKNIYPIWNKYVKDAKQSIVVISPYVDNTVKDLLTSQHILKNVKIRIITRIDSDTIFDKPYQLRALINCMKKKIQVLHLDDLHAKLLIIDEKYLSVGSQNFTQRGKKNKEVTMISKTSFENSKFLKVIQKWISCSAEIEIELLLMLEKELKKYNHLLKKLKESHNNSYAETLDQFTQSKKQKLINSLNRKYQNSNLRFASDKIFLTMTTIRRKYYRQTTLLADSHYDLQKWKNRKDSKTDISLARLIFYPMLNSDNFALAFVRLGSTRISSFLYRYISEIRIENFYFKIVTNFPQENTNKLNLEFKFEFFDRSWNKYEAKLGYFFNGINCDRIFEEFSSPEAKSVLKKLFLKNKKIESNFLNSYFKPVNLGTHGISIDSFLNGHRYKLYIIQHFTSPILVAEKIR